MKTESTRKLISLDRAVQEVNSARRQGLRVVLANGCFDLIHVGHLRYLEGAAREGDRLVVAVNGDESVRALKGSGRPLMTAPERAEIVAGFECVDWVVIFEERTVTEVIRALVPDVHAKGTDYSEESVPEKDLVRSLGGRVAIVGDPKERSSSDYLRKVSDR